MTRQARGMTALWLLVLPFTIWAAHFVAAYVVTAIYCAKSPQAAAEIATVRWIVTAVTVLALAALVAVLRFGYARCPREAVSSGRRARSAGGAAGFLRSVLSMMTALAGLAVLYVGAVVFFFGDCR